MDAGQIAVAAVLAILGFWVVGAYNRLVRLRNVAAKAYAGCDAVLVERIAETDRLCDALVRAGGEPREFIALARAAARQAAQACEAARARPLLKRTMLKVVMTVAVLDGALHALRRTAPQPVTAPGPGAEPAPQPPLAPAAEPAATAPPTDAPLAAQDAEPSTPASAEEDRPEAATPDDAGAPTGPEATPVETSEAHADAAAAALANTVTATETETATAADGAAEAAPQPDLAAVAQSLQALDTLAPRWDVAQSHYDAAVLVYNEAAHQFPTRIVAVLFSLRPAQNLAPLWPDTLGASLAPPG
jgi:hypothetical protein